ncbi:MAG TPA: NAD-dependent epimerase/dehydratase family protein [Thermodesulfobacteriaceae bacterium]|nr:NAD-dependent epimerase/dehydratase family protein [Thermodesulfobacteriaceae bacterium]
MEKSTVLVTGSSGLVGSAVVRRLVRAGYSVRALVRPTSDIRNIRGLGIETVTGDLTEPASIKKAARDCRYVFHVAADYRLWVPDPEPMYRANVEGTGNVMSAALENGVERIVYTSSVAVLKTTSDGTAVDENGEATLDDMIGHYKRSKFLAEELVKKMISEEGLPAVIVNPSTPVGPGDVKPTPTGRVIVDAASGKIPAYVNTGLNVVHVDDVAEGHVQALERGRIGERYILGAENLTLREMLAEIAGIAGRKPPRIRLPHNVLYPVARISEKLAEMRGGPEPRVTMDGVRMSRKTMFFSSRKAEDELGYRPRPSREALRDALNWFRKHGYIR